MVDWAKELDRFEERCRVFRDEETTGSVTLTVKFMDGQPASFLTTRTLHRVMGLSPLDAEPAAVVLQRMWAELKRENRRFFGEVVIRRLYHKGSLVEQEESDSIRTQ